MIDAPLETFIVYIILQSGMGNCKEQARGIFVINIDTPNDNIYYVKCFHKQHPCQMDSYVLLFMPHDTEKET